MRPFTRIASLAFLAIILPATGWAQERPGKDGDEFGAGFEEVVDHSESAGVPLRRCAERLEPLPASALRNAAPVRSAEQLSAPERYWLAQRARRNPAATRQCELSATPVQYR